VFDASKNTKFDVHWPLSDTVWTPGWIGAEPAGAQVGSAAAGAAMASVAAIVAAIRWGLDMLSTTTARAGTGDKWSL
jgi:hypothetical protein